MDIKADVSEMGWLEDRTDVKKVDYKAVQDDGLDEKKKEATDFLFNKEDREILEERVKKEPFSRKTVSFYRYCKHENLQEYRDDLYKEWRSLGVLGRTYLASEGINAQISIPDPNYEAFVSKLNNRYPGIPLKEAIDESLSFIKLIVRIKKKILADGMCDNEYDPSDVGTHLSAEEFNEAMNHEGTVVVDVRNHYESEIGHFQGALLPDVDSFREELPVIKEMLAGKEKNKVLLYCTGGIRCEKASAWLKHQGFQDVNQLHGGIIDYARQIKEQNLENKFIGKNFVFDRRMGERISSEIIAKCHQCGRPADTHRNCSWQACHILFIQCEECENKMEGCCSPECMEFVKLPLEEQKKLRKEVPAKKADFFHSRRRPDEKIRCTN